MPAATNLPNQAAVNTLFTGYGVDDAGQQYAEPRVSTTMARCSRRRARRTTRARPADGYAVIAGNVRMPVGPQTIIQNPLDRKSVFTKFDYEFTPTVTAYGQILYVDSDVFTSSGRSLTQFGTLTTIPVTNPFIPDDLRTLLASRPNATAPFTWNGRYVGIPSKAWDEQYTTAQYLGGLKGALPVKDWTWDVFAAYDNTDHLQSEPERGAEEPGAEPAECAGWRQLDLRRRLQSVRRQQQHRDLGCVPRLHDDHGEQHRRSEPDHLPGRDAGIDRRAAGRQSRRSRCLADHRRNTYRYRPDSQLAAQNIEAVIASQPTQGDDLGRRVRGADRCAAAGGQAAGQEAECRRRVPPVGLLHLAAASNSYEGDLRWEPVASLLVRGGYQRAVRAPNIGELFAAASGSQIAFGTPPAAIGDPCDIRSTARTGAGGASVRSLCLAQGIPAAVIDNYTFPTTATAGRTQGNRALDPEIADTYNFGFRGRRASRLAAAERRHRFRRLLQHQDRAGDLGRARAFRRSASATTSMAPIRATTPTNTFCQLLQRDSNGLLQVINTPYLNLGGLKTQGIDLQFGWNAALETSGSAAAACSSTPASAT